MREYQTDTHPKNISDIVSKVNQSYTHPQMPPYLVTTNLILSLLTVIADALVILLAVSFVLARLGHKIAFFEMLKKICGRRASLLSFLVALGSVAASLFYSNIAGFIPCTLCWWQRIFLYPQAVIFGAAIFLKQKTPRVYAMALAIPGFLIAVYHTYLQFGGSPLLPCSADTATSCAQRYFLNFGYVTIPTMALTAFALIIVLMLSESDFTKKQSS